LTFFTSIREQKHLIYKFIRKSEQFVYGDISLGFVKVAIKNDLLAGKMKLVEVNGIPILLANIEGEYFAIENKCTHRGCKLSNGTLIGKIVKCKCHGSSFNVKTGEVVHGPASKPEPKYIVKIEGDEILVST
jgi:nitrite reductase/ring-hydroxylating ferredoxin subunit